MRLTGFFALVMSLTACGNHAEIGFEGVTAQRLSDDTVQLTATVRCSTVGVDDCGSLKHHCVTAEWYSKVSLDGDYTEENGRIRLSDNGYGSFGEASALVQAEGCSDKVLRDGDQDTIVVASSAPVPTKEPLVIRASVTTSGGGGPDELEWLMTSP